MSGEPFRFGFRAHWQAVEVCPLLHLLRELAPIRTASCGPQNLLRTLKCTAHTLLLVASLVEPLLRLRHLVGDAAQAPLQPTPVARRLRACTQIANVPTLVRRHEIQAVESLQQIVPHLQNAHRAIHLAETRIDSRLVAARIELLRRIQRHRHESQIPDKLIVRIRPQLLQIPMRLDDSAARIPALTRQHCTSRLVRVPPFYNLNVLLHFHHVPVSRTHILQNLLNHLHRLISQLPMPVRKLARRVLQHPRQLLRWDQQRLLRRCAEQCRLQLHTLLGNRGNRTTGTVFPRTVFALRNGFHHFLERTRLRHRHTQAAREHVPFTWVITTRRSQLQESLLLASHHLSVLRKRRHFLRRRESLHRCSS